MYDKCQDYEGILNDSSRNDNSLDITNSFDCMDSSRFGGGFDVNCEWCGREEFNWNSI